MSEFPSVYPDIDTEHAKYRTCRICGGVSTNVFIIFKNGTVAPTVGETIAGATSGDTAVVVSSGLYTGTYAGSNAVGWIDMNTATGVDADGCWGTSGESLNGSTGGAAAWKLNQVGSQVRTGRYYNEDELVEQDGYFYCRQHLLFRYRPKWRDAWRVEISEEDFDQ